MTGEPPRPGGQPTPEGRHPSADESRPSAESDAASEPPGLTRLDPDAAAEARTPPGSRTPPHALPRTARGERPPPPPPPVIDVRRYRWAIGIIGLAVVIGVSVYQFATHGTGDAGVRTGTRLPWFAAPLATGDLQGDANLRPPCTLARHDPRALNLCLVGHRTAVVLAFFAPQSSSCVRQVDALQTLSRRFPSTRVTFAAVAVHASHAATARLVRSHGWTIPVAYDADGSVAQQYGVVVCPMVELARRGGRVAGRLIGDRWASSAALRPHVAALLRPSG